ncbi:MAG: TlpA family protein disulfide reductase [Proteobacteria bacterium]|nr:TlpA family protein disulfide reductase [Pseudomonadota bacterium]MBU1687410.1 TlpA family protein disulfide reductase [Pseudomonadota bacterium]
MMKKLSLILLFCIPLFIAACGKEPKIATVGEPAPDFTLVDVQGKTWTLSQLKGQVIFINFWATWCPPCREEMPSMQRLLTKMPTDKFKMLAVLHKDTSEAADQFAKKLNLTIPILLDPNNQTGSKYGLTGVPETYIVDKQGVLREKVIGPAQWDSQNIQKVLMGYINQQ